MRSSTNLAERFSNKDQWRDAGEEGDGESCLASLLDATHRNGMGDRGLAQVNGSEKNRPTIASSQSPLRALSQRANKDRLARIVKSDRRRWTSIPRDVRHSGKRIHEYKARPDALVCASVNEASSMWHERSPAHVHTRR